MEALSNPWVIGIGGGILSGLLVTLITRYLFSRRDNREYTQKIVTANQEILYAIRPGISEEVIPSQDVLDSLISATALKYGVDAGDLHTAPAFADVLVKEVMDSSFLSASAKAEFCQKLTQLSRGPTATQQAQICPPEPIRDRTRLWDYRRRMITLVSLMMGVLAALMTGIFAFSQLLDRPRAETSVRELYILVPTAMTILVVFAATYSMWMLRFLERKRKERRPASPDTLEEDTKEDEMRGN